ncbi:unnamed protein product [Brassica oleracea]
MFRRSFSDAVPDFQKLLTPLIPASEVDGGYTRPTTSSRDTVRRVSWRSRSSKTITFTSVSTCPVFPTTVSATESTP